MTQLWLLKWDFDYGASSRDFKRELTWCVASQCATRTIIHTIWHLLAVTECLRACPECTELDSWSLLQNHCHHEFNLWWKVETKTLEMQKKGVGEADLSSCQVFRFQGWKETLWRLTAPRTTVKSMKMWSLSTLLKIGATFKCQTNRRWSRKPKNDNSSNHYWNSQHGSFARRESSPMTMHRYIIDC